jgi:hypothetical protein
MNRILLLVGLTVLFADCVSEVEPGNDAVPTIDIPLNRIYAIDMPGTRSVRELEPEKFGKSVRRQSSAEQSRLLHESLTQQIRGAIHFPDTIKGELAGKAFAVRGAGREALESTKAILVDGESSEFAFPADSELTLVFFSHLFGDYVHVEQVERHASTIQVRYRFIPHMNKMVTEHFALIPLGRLPVGEYQVEFTQLPLPERFVRNDEEFVPDEMVNKIVCKPFEFSVIKAQESN